MVKAVETPRVSGRESEGVVHLAVELAYVRCATVWWGPCRVGDMNRKGVQGIARSLVGHEIPPASVQVWWSKVAEPG